MGEHEASKFMRPGSGLVDGMRAFTLQADEFSILQNVKQYIGNLTSRGGATAVGSSLGSATVTWTFTAYGTDVATALVVRLAACSTKIKYKIGAGAWTDLKTGLTAGTYWVAVQWKNHVYLCDGVNTPQDITIANPPTVTDWITFPSGINPTWVVLHYQKLKYGGDLTTPNYYYQTEFGTANTTLTTSFYLQPDDQNGNYPKIAVTNRNRVAMFCQDFLIAHSGAGPNSDQFFQMPRGAACTAWRSVVDMGEFGVFYLSERGVSNWDLNSPPEPIDPFGRINWGNIDLTTEAYTWAMRVGDVYRIFFKSKGDIQNTTASASAVLVSSTALTRMSNLFSGRTFLTRTAFTTSGSTDHYYDYDCRRKVWSGPHTGQYLSGHWTQYRYGDTQDPILGDSTTGGVVVLADQQSAFTDNTVPFTCLIRTGVIGNPYKHTKISRITAKFGVLQKASATVDIRVLQMGSDTPVAQYTANLNSMAPVGQVAGSLNPPAPMADFVQVEFVPDYKGRAVQLEPQVEFQYAGGEGFELRGYIIEFEEV
jgi:hypothetical protein